MYSIIVIDRSGTLKEIKVKSAQDVYKKCGFRKLEGFQKRHVWNEKIGDKKYYIGLFSRLTGKTNTENKYDLPPPLDTELYFGSCALVNFNSDGEIDNLTLDEWEKIYEKLFGGFEDIGNSDDDDDEEDELNQIASHKLTKKGGYLKDGFVVDTDSDGENIILSADKDYNSEDDGSFTGGSSEEGSSDTGDDDSSDDSDCESELSSEQYEYSDED